MFKNYELLDQLQRKKIIYFNSQRQFESVIPGNNRFQCNFYGVLILLSKLSNQYFCMCCVHWLPMHSIHIRMHADRRKQGECEQQEQEEAILKKKTISSKITENHDVHHLNLGQFIKQHNLSDFQLVNFLLTCFEEIWNIFNG